MTAQWMPDIVWMHWDDRQTTISMRLALHSEPTRHMQWAFLVNLTKQPRNRLWLWLRSTSSSRQRDNTVLERS